MSFYDPSMGEKLQKLRQSQFDLLMKQREAQEYMLRHPDHYSQGLNLSSAQQKSAVPSVDPKHDNLVLLLL